jgi:murein DD-endopeptidase MepM/ murein hydrolase activator NlpD
MARRMASRLRLLVVMAALPLLLWLLSPVVSRGASSAAIQHKITQKQGQIRQRRAHEQVLSTTIAGFSRRIGALESNITSLQGRQVHLQADLDAKRAELGRIQAQLRAEKLRLAKLRARFEVARTALAKRLVDLYEADQPDIVTVVLESNGFQQLLENADFMHRISQQDATIVDAVRTAKAQATAAAKRLARLEVRAQAVANSIEQRRNEVAQVKGQLIDRRDRYQQARSQKAQALATTRDQRQHLQDDVAALQRQQSRIQAALQASAASNASSGGTDGPIRQGGGLLIWPVNGPITSPFCERRAWEACHPGIDIGVPEGTPIHAAAAGRVALMEPVASSGGYGNYTCIQHTASLSTCYAHQSRFATSVGAFVHQGQVIGYTGCTGLCFGPHLHFEVRINGSVVNPMNYL